MLRFLNIVTLAGALLFYGTPVTAGLVTENDIMIVVSNSGSMKNYDPGVSALEAIKRFIQASDENTRIGILSFNEYVTVVSPLTHIDLETISELRQHLDNLEPQGLLSNSAAAVERSIYELNTHSRVGANKIIILITDTYIHTMDPNNDHKFEKWLREILANNAVESGIQVVGIAIGEDADIQSLQILAEKTGGQYYQAKTAHDTQAAVEKIHRKLFEGTKELARSAEPSPIPQKYTVETPPLLTTTGPEMENENIWKSPPNTDYITQAQQPHPTGIEHASRDSDHRLEKKLTDPVSSAAPTALEPTHITWIAKTQLPSFITALLICLTAVIVIIWLLMRRQRRVAMAQNDPTTLNDFTPETTVSDEEILSNTILRSGDTSPAIETDDKTRIRSISEQSPH